MAKTIVGLFDTTQEAQSVVQDLVDSGFDRNKISLVANNANSQYQMEGDKDGSGRPGGVDTQGDDAGDDAGKGAVSGTFLGGGVGLLVGLGALLIPGIGPVIAAGPIATVLGATALGAGVGAAAGGLIGALTHQGVSEEDAGYYSEGVKRGGTLVVVNAQDETANDAYDIMQRHGAVDIDERGGQWKQEGWSGFDPNSQYNTEQVDTYRNQYATAAPTSTTNTYATDTTTTNYDQQNTNYNQQNYAQQNTQLNDQGEAVLPVTQEELQIGKRAVQRGGVRVYSHTTEQPVEEQVQLREETVNVERRPVNRPVSDADMASFQEGTIEVTETDEEAVVAKQARVVEEVVVNKNVDTRTETVRDSVRRTDVDVEQIEGDTRYTDTNTTYTTQTNTDDVRRNNDR